MKPLKKTQTRKGGDKANPNTVRIGDVDVTVATPAGKPKNRTAAEIRAAVRAAVQAAK